MSSDLAAAAYSGMSEQALIDEITRLEDLKNSIAAQQAEAIRAFARTHVESETSRLPIDLIEPEKLERSIVAQVALACRTSPTLARKQLRAARDLHDGLDHVRALFTAGALGERQVGVIVEATSHLDSAERAQVDQQLATAQVHTLGVGRIRDLTRRLAATVAPEKFTDRCTAARSGRHVRVRPAADGMADLVAHLPVEQAVTCYAALRKAANDLAARPEPLTRSRSQVMADTFVERLTGHACAEDVHLDVQVVVPVEALLDPTDPTPAQIPGHGPVPVALVARGSGKKTWRRLITREGVVIGGDSHRRTFTGTLAHLIRQRDGGRCREPYCDAPIRHLDHITRWAGGGDTTFDNGRGLCEFHNLTRETPGWAVEKTGATTTTRTPTGHIYDSSPPANHSRPPTRRDTSGRPRVPSRRRTISLDPSSSAKPDFINDPDRRRPVNGYRQLDIGRSVPAEATPTVG